MSKMCNVSSSPYRLLLAALCICMFRTQSVTGKIQAPSISKHTGSDVEVNWRPGAPQNHGTKPRLVFHIGMVKTGTTTVQSAFKLPKNQAYLKAHGVYYATHQGITMNQFALWMLADDWEAAQRKYQQVLKEAARKRAHTVFVSAEVLSMLSPHPDKLERFRQMLGDDVALDVHISFRNQHDFVRSWLQQRLKRGLSVFERPEQLTWKLHYATIIANWEAVFGEEHVHVHCYEDVGSHLVRLFLRELNALPPHLDIHDDRKIQTKSGLKFKVPRNSHNVSPDPGTQAMMLLSGLSDTWEEYWDWAPKYSAVFSGVKIKEYAFTSHLVDAATMMAVGASANTTHPKLEQCRKHLDHREELRFATVREKYTYVERMHELFKVLMQDLATELQDESSER